MKPISSHILATVVVAGLSAASSQAAVFITASDVGGNVEFVGAGTLNLTGLSPLGDSSDQGAIAPFLPSIAMGADPAAFTPMDLYFQGSISGPSFFGSGGSIVADSGTGDRFGLLNIAGPGLSVAVPDGYISGAALAGTLTFTGTDFDTLGLEDGTYVWSWGSGANADTLTLVIPEPASGAMLASCALMLNRRRRVSCQQ